jgi:putative oxidoreductase
MNDSRPNVGPVGGSAWALLPLRLMVGFGFAAHGYAKLSRGPEHFAAILDSIGVPLPHLMAWVTALLEFFGGISIMAGAFVVLLSLPLAIIMVTAMFSVHLRYGFSSIRLQGVTADGAQFGPIGYELNLLYLAGLLALALHGAGRLSVEHWLTGRQRGAPGLSLLGHQDAARAAPKVRVGLLVSLEAKPGNEAALESFLRGGVSIVEQEPATISWYALRLGPTTFGIFDSFPDDAGRQGHLAGRVAAALMAQAPELLASTPTIEMVDILAAKLPG